ncbi:MAG: hypothetical protein Alpg2KO_17420 [Alphaproteobacteria bacterium]
MAVLPYMIAQSYRAHVKQRNWKEFREDPAKAAHLEHLGEFGAAFRGDNIKLAEWIDGLDDEKMALMSQREQISIKHAMLHRPNIPHVRESETELFNDVRTEMVKAINSGKLGALKKANKAYMDAAHANRRAFVSHMHGIDSALASSPDAAVEWLGGLSGFHRQDMRHDYKTITRKIGKKIEEIEKKGGPTSESGEAALAALRTTMHVVGEDIRISAVDRHDRIKSSVERYKQTKPSM